MLPIGPREAFLLSRIDGICSEAELALLTGFEVDVVSSCIDRLIELGAVSVDVPAPSPRTASAPADSEACDLDAGHRRRILELAARLDELDHYELLGVASSADRKEIKKAYYEQAPAFHPDRFFGKKLGPYQAKMEAIFARMTLAYETLGSRERRDEYDAYLAMRRKTRAIERALAAELVPPPSVRASAEPSPSADSTAHASAPSPRPSSVAPRVSPTPITPPSPVTTIVRDPDDERARRAALARKLGGARLGISSMPPRAPAPSSAPSAPLTSTSAARSTSATPSIPAAASPSTAASPSAAPSGAPSSGPSTAPFPSAGSSVIPPSTRVWPAASPSSAAALEELMRRRESTMAGAKRAQILRYIDEAQKARAANDPAGAANAYRLARSLDPENPEIVAAAEQAAREAATALAAAYSKQGEYEEREGRWAEAARSYTRAAAGMPESSEIHEKAAYAIMHARGDLHQAADLARRAVALTPHRLAARLVLAEVYIAAGLGLAARRELDAARQIAPHDGRIQELAKLVR